MSILDQLNKQKQEVQESFKKDSSSVNGDGLINSVLIPIEVPRDGGKLRLYISVSPEAVSNPRVLKAVLDEISDSFDLAVWQSHGSEQSGFKKSWRKF